MSLKDKIELFKKRSLKNNLLSGILISLSVLLGSIILFSALEYSFWFDTITRAIIFYLILLTFLSIVIFKILPHLWVFLGWKNDREDEEAAREISSKLHELDDQLINYLQLEKNAENELAQASLNQKSSKLIHIDFLKAIDTRKKRSYARYFMLISAFLLFVALINPPILSSGTQRLVMHNQAFERPAPFSFEILNDSLTAFRNQSFDLSVRIVGENVPTALNIITSNGLSPFQKDENGQFKYVFHNPTDDINFQLEASGFTSKSYTLELISKPSLNLLSIDLVYPSHTGRKSETITNSGNINAPAGTIATWILKSSFASSAQFHFKNDTLSAKRKDENNFTFSRKLEESGNYHIQLQNSYSVNESALDYKLNITQDEPPKIEIAFLPDTSTYSFVVITGRIVDDYGFHSLSIHYEIENSKSSKQLQINRNAKSQAFYADWSADSLQIKPNQNLIIYAIVRDNDALSGYKSVKSDIFYFKKPSLSELSDAIEKKSQGTENQLDKSISEMDELKKTLEDLAKKLKSQKEIGWQEEKLIEESLEQQEALEKMLEELKKKHDDLLKANENFKQSEPLKEKSEQLNQIMDDLMDEQTRQLYEELKKLMQEKAPSDEIREKLNQINRQENKRAQDLERTKELFKRLKMESDLERVSQQLDSLANKQNELSEKPQDTANQKEQEDIKSEFEELTKDLDAVEELNQELERPEALEDFNSDEKQIEQEMKKALEEMKAGDKQKSKKSQQNAAQQMMQMSKKMQKMQAGMEMEVMEENIEQLRKILDDLIRLSFRQEGLIENFKTVNQLDPRFVTLSQGQLKLKEDLVVIEDSLMSLANRVVQISSFITKEIDDIDMHMAASIEQIRERQRGRTLSHQQFAMTSMNNLALLLNDVLQQMQMSMSEAQGKGKKGKPKESSLPSLGEMQQQLGDEIKRLQDGNKSGQALSEELARLAAEQEMIRQQLQEMQEKMKGQFGGESISNELKKAIEMMEDNEVDLVNKKITKQLMERQKAITTRLLQAEKAMKEQEQEPEREGESGKQRERLFPPAYEEYLRERKKEIELLRSVPIELKPFYKKEVNDYFRRLSEKN